MSPGWPGTGPGIECGVTMAETRKSGMTGGRRPARRPRDSRQVEAARRRLPDAATVDAVSRSMHALGEPARLRIAVALRAAGELSVRDLAAAVDVSEPATSQHLRVLRAERLVRNRRDGRMVFYSLSDDHIRDLIDVAVAHAAHRG